MTRLEAVNQILAAIGEPPVTALDTGGTSLEGEAETYLDDASSRIQGEGWAANTSLNVAHEPDVNDQIVFSTTVLSVYPTGQSQHKPYGMKASRLYDWENRRDTFTEDAVYLDLIEECVFTQLPETLQRLILAEARLRFERYKKRGAADDRILQSELHEARRRANAEDARLRTTANILDTAEALDIRGGRHRGGYRNAFL